jgi:hypothetical protein
MVAYSFNSRFVEPIRAGLGLIGMFHGKQEIPCEFVIDDGDTKARAFDPERDLDPPIRPKRQTIRAIGRRRHAHPGETLQLYTGMRTKQCRKIGEARCVSVDPIRIDFKYRYHPSWPAGRIEWGDPFHVCQGQENLNNFARQDGFLDWNEMLVFWGEEHGLGEFRGVMIRWEPLT